MCSVLQGKLTLSKLTGACAKVFRSGCSTFLKTIAGETHGFQVSSDSYLNYQGVPASDMSTMFRGEAVYTAEVDAHFPQLNVGDTLYFSAMARAPRTLPGGVTREQYAAHLRDVSTSSGGSRCCWLTSSRSSWLCSESPIQSTLVLATTSFEELVVENARELRSRKLRSALHLCSAGTIVSSISLI